MVILRSQNKITDFFYDFRPGLVPLNTCLDSNFLNLGKVIEKIVQMILEDFSGDKTYVFLMNLRKIVVKLSLLPFITPTLLLSKFWD